MKRAKKRLKTKAAHKMTRILMSQEDPPEERKFKINKIKFKENRIKLTARIAWTAIFRSTTTVFFTIRQGIIPQFAVALILRVTNTIAMAVIGTVKNLFILLKLID